VTVEGSRRQAVREILGAPRVTVTLAGPHAEGFHRAFTARHPRLKLPRAKTWGVALLPVPASFDEYLAARPRSLHRARRRALGGGFEVRPFASSEHLDEILEINGSAPARQGVAMKTSYLKPASLERWAERHPSCEGAFGGDGRLRAYVTAPEVGDTVILNRLLAHAAFLREGVMYLLVTEVVGRLAEQRAAEGRPSWVMYDTLRGARPGLEEFKRRLGFEPYRVRWKLAGGR